jgi:hypothetical protein
MIPKVFLGENSVKIRLRWEKILIRNNEIF